MDALNILFGPIITEKSMADAANGKYTFKVFKGANKTEIKKVVEEKFKVNVVKISTVTIKGRSLRAGVKRLEIMQPAFKKALVKVKQGQKIGIFDTGTK
jgi:large subunit ribosomal protein L23